MRKEIFEQSIVPAQTLQSYVRPFEGEVALPELEFDLASIDRVTIVARGTSYHAGMVACRSDRGQDNAGERPSRHPWKREM